MSKLFLGVDGGGSKTELCVADGSGKTLLTLNGGATSFKSVGNAAAFANMREPDGAGRLPGGTHSKKRLGNVRLRYAGGPGGL